MSTVKFKITDFKAPNLKEGGNRYFIFKGEKIKEKTWGPFYKRIIVWSETYEMGYKTFPEAVQGIKEIQSMQPQDYFIK